MVSLNAAVEICFGVYPDPSYFEKTSLFRFSLVVGRVDHADCLVNLFAAMKKDISILKDFLLDPLGEINITGDEYEDYDYDRYYDTEQEQLTEFELDTFVYIKGN